MNTIYLDNAGTTRCTAGVMGAVQRTIEDCWGNPSSMCKHGRDAHNLVERSRDTIFDYLGASHDDKVIFTSSGSEANTLAITGYCNHYHTICVTDPIEHHSIINNPKVLIAIPVDRYGFVDQNVLNDLLQECYQNSGVLVSIQYANNEIGTIQDIKSITKIVHRHGCKLHVDATQYIYGLKDILKTIDIDMISFSGHKIHAPKGVGCLYIKNGIDIDPIIYGGQQEYGLRGGTENVPYIVGLREAINEVHDTLAESWIQIVKQQRDKLKEDLVKKISDIYVTTPEENCLPGTLNICFAGVDSESLITVLDGDKIETAAGSACNTNSVGREPSYVLKAVGVPKKYIWGALRLTWGDTPLGYLDSDYPEIDYVEEKIIKAVKALRDIQKYASPFATDDDLPGLAPAT